MEKFLTELNEAQRKAVLDTEGSSLVIAGAGSGKTRVLTYRIAYLLSKGVVPSTILALTFTNKAAREMKDRIGKLVGEVLAKYLWMGTFHSIFARILRYESEALGYKSNYTIYDTIDSKNVVKTIIKDLKLNDKVYKPGEVFGRISSAKNNLITAQAYFSNSQLKQYDQTARRPHIANIFKLYASRCKKADAMDFDDLLLNTNILFRDFPDILKKYQEKFKYILVDEYQDTNYAQYLIVKKLAERHKNVCVVGDDAQSIYSFRGAKIENILNFKNDYPDYTLYKLEQNYRSTQTIVNAANSIIAKNKGQIQKKVYSKNEHGDKLQVVSTLTDNEEGFVVSNLIIDTRLNEQQQYSDFAVLYRTNAQSRILEEALRKRNVPYRVYGSISFYQRKEIKDIIAYLRLIVNPDDDEAFKRIINYPARGIGNTTVSKLESLANQQNISLWKTAIEIEKYTGVFNRGTIGKISTFMLILQEFQQKNTTDNAYDVAQFVASKTGILKDLYEGVSIEERSRYENMEELLNGINEFVVQSEEEEELPNLDRWLENIALLTDADTDTEEDRNKVALMTMHSAKGLEFNYVIISGVEENLFPSQMSLDNPKDMEEERRLFYVAVTRARKKVFITYARSRYRWGLPTDCKPSRFLEDVESCFLDWPELESDISVDKVWDPFSNSPKTKKQKKQAFLPNNKNLVNFGHVSNSSIAPKPANPNFIPDNPEKIQVGMRVEHQRFGKGKVIYVEGTSPHKKATVFFQESGTEKQLLLKFAKLRIVESS